MQMLKINRRQFEQLTVRRYWKVKRLRWTLFIPPSPSLSLQYCYRHVRCCWEFSAAHPGAITAWVNILKAARQQMNFRFVIKIKCRSFVNLVSVFRFTLGWMPHWKSSQHWFGMLTLTLEEKVINSWTTQVFSSTSSLPGTYFDFALVFPDTRPGAYRIREIGVTCSGQRGADDSKTLSQAKFQIGDYLDINISPPNRKPEPRQDRRERRPY